MTDSMGILQEWSEEELDNCRPLSRVDEPAPSPLRGQRSASTQPAQFRYLDLSSSALVPSPRAISSRARAISDKASGSERSWRVSSSAARSSGLINTAAARPFLVSVIRSCRLSMRSTISESRALISARGRVSESRVFRPLFCHQQRDCKVGRCPRSAFAPLWPVASTQVITRATQPPGTIGSCLTVNLRCEFR